MQSDGYTKTFNWILGCPKLSEQMDPYPPLRRDASYTRTDTTPMMSTVKGFRPERITATLLLHMLLRCTLRSAPSYLR
jgi:hypothetical protein